MGIPNKNYYGEKYDLHNCDKEPLHRIRRSQSYGSFVSCNLSGDTWYHASEDIMNILKTKSLSQFVFDETGIEVQDITTKKEPQFLSNESYDKSLIVHSVDYGYLLEIEPLHYEARINFRKNPYRDVILKLSEPQNQKELMEEVIHQVYASTGYDHIMLYKFDSDYSGEIIAEKRVEDSPSYLGLKFPSTDIPKQARNLYLSEKVRIIHNASSDGNIIFSNNEEDCPSLDLTGVSMRGVSPIHREYLGNMGVQSSFSVAIIIKEKLWGLIACHNKNPKFINFNTRIWLKFLSDLISISWEKVVRHDADLSRANNLLIESQLVENILSSQDLIVGLLESEGNIMELIPSDGILIKSNEKIRGIGNLPDPSTHEGIFNWLDEMETFNVKAIKSTKSVIPEDLYSPYAAGILVLKLSDLSGDYIIWLRQEASIDVVWAGNPEQTKNFDSDKGRISPRKSFESWKETYTDIAKPWRESEIGIAQDLRREVIEHLYKKYNEVLMLNTELNEAYKELESFSYSVSHDLKAPLRSIEGFTQILKEDYSSTLDQNGIKLLDIITRSIKEMKLFIHEILNYSKLNQQSLNVLKVDINEVVETQWKVLNLDNKNGAQLEIVSEFPIVYGDHNMIKQIFSNLLSNSLKYVDENVPPQIKISHTADEKVVTIIVEDNGIGIPSEQRERIFEVFRRLKPNDEKYEGSGVGLSIVKKAVERHGGKIQVKDSTIANTGARFEFGLPMNQDFVEMMERRKARLHN